MNAILVGGDKHGLGVDIFDLVDHISMSGQAYHRTNIITIDNKAFHVYVYIGCASLEQWEIEERVIDAMKQFSGNNKWLPSSQDEQLDYSSKQGSSTNIVGTYADKVPGSDKRTTATVSGRFLEEAVELALEAGLTTGEIYAHITDAIYNQYVKASKKSGEIVYPSSQIASTPETYKANLAGEIGDVSVMLMDIAHRAGIDYEAARQSKIQAFINKVNKGQFYANDKGLLYVRKPHMSFSKSEVKPDDEHDARI